MEARTSDDVDHEVRSVDNTKKQKRNHKDVLCDGVDEGTSVAVGTQEPSSLKARIRTL